MSLHHVLPVALTACFCVGITLSTARSDEPSAGGKSKPSQSKQQPDGDKAPTDKSGAAKPDAEKPAAEKPETDKPGATEPGDAKPAAKPGDKAPQPLNPQGTVLLDTAGKRVLIKAKVVLREGSLELLCCLKQTKEHEAILSVDAKAYVVHTALLALGIKPGAPAKFEPEFQPAKGTAIKIFVNWIDTKGKAHRVPAQDLIRRLTRRFYVAKVDPRPADLVIPEKSELRYDSKHKELLWYGQMTADEKKTLLALSEDKVYRKAIETFFEQSQNHPMDATWVFTGSQVYKDPDTGKSFYLAEDGDLISVANFASATLDVTMRSSNSNDALNFEAWTERVPPLDTDVTIELIPVVGARD